MREASQLSSLVQECSDFLGKPIVFVCVGRRDVTAGVFSFPQPKFSLDGMLISIALQITSRYTQYLLSRGGPHHDFIAATRAAPKKPRTMDIPQCCWHAC